MASKYAVIDIESTGLDPEVDRIIEIGIIHLDSHFHDQGSWHSLVRPLVPVAATHIHGLTDSDLAYAPTFGEIADSLLAQLDGRVLVAHNFGFDRSFINAELHRIGRAERVSANNGVCTMDQSRVYLPDGSHSLVGVAQRLGIQTAGHHRALADAGIAAKLLREYVARENAGERFNNCATNREGALVEPAQWKVAVPYESGLDGQCPSNPHA